MLPFLKFDHDYVKSLDPNLDNKAVRVIILIFLKFPARLFEPVEAYISLFKLVHNIIRAEISRKKVKFLYTILKKSFF